MNTYKTPDYRTDKRKGFPKTNPTWQIEPIEKPASQMMKHDPIAFYKAIDAEIEKRVMRASRKMVMEIEKNLAKEFNQDN